MSFKINLKPYPAAEYFTVREHARAKYKTSVDFHTQKIIVINKLKVLFNIPDASTFHTIKSAQRDAVPLDQNVIVKDDPTTGVDMLKKEPGKSDSLILDLSYSFPQLPENYSEISSVLIDPAISLGVPIPISFLISENKLPIIPAFQKVGSSEDNALFLLDLVLNDYLEKGIDVVLRESNYKAAVLNQLMEDCTFFVPITEKQIRSKTIILAETNPDITPRIEKMGYEVGVMQENGKSILAIANYPTHSKELIEMFADRMMAI